MRNITLAIDEQTLLQGRDYASNSGISFNAMVRQLIAQKVNKTDKKQWLDETLKLLDGAHGNSHGKKWTRDELYYRNTEPSGV
jgi:hypothetical protein